MNIQTLEAKLKSVTDRKNQLLKELQTTNFSKNTFRKIGNSDWWYGENKYLSVSNNSDRIWINIPEDKHLYISYYESNVDFNKAPSNPLEYKKEEMEVTFSGVATDGVEITLFIVGYKNDEKVKLFQTKLNQTNLFSIKKDEIDHFRLAVKVKGKGEFNINRISLDELEILGFGNANLDFTSPAKVGFDSKYEEHSVDVGLDSFEQTYSFELNDIDIPSVDQNYFSVQKKYLNSDLPGNRYSYLSLNTGTDSQKVQSSSHYKIAFTAQKDKNLLMDLILLELSNNIPIGVKCISYGETQMIKFNKDTEEIRFLLRVRSKGSFSDLQIGLSEQIKKTTNMLEIELEKEHWYNPSPSLIDVLNTHETLIIKTDNLEGKKQYLSYKAANNSFSKVPEESIFDISEEKYYEIEIAADKSGSGIFSPILIGYSESEKKEIIPLEVNKVNQIKFKTDVVKCRIAFTILGTINVKISSFHIREYPVIKTGGEMKWLNAREVKELQIDGKRDLTQLKMAVIFDEFTTHCFSPECNVITFSPDNWKEKLTESNPDFLMVESAWRGNKGSWTKKVQYTSEESIEDLRKLISWCKENNIPTIFWNKEDPVHYNHFIKTARLFDYVFTTDVNMVSVYKEDCGHDRVDFLQFAAQPAIHNPIAIGKREKAASFAGSYYAKHTERSEDMLRIFNASIPYGLAIFDRNYEKVKQGLLPNNRFPDHLEPNIRGTLKYYEIDKSYKGFRVMINVNTVKDSPTMFARRVYEGLASGTPIVSTYSEGVDKIFGDLVCVSEDEREITKAFDKLFNDDQEYRRIAVEGIRRVLSEHTYSHRLEKIINKLHLPFVRIEKEVTVLAKAQTIEEAKQVIFHFKNQVWKNKKLCLFVKPDLRGSISETDPSITLWLVDDFIEMNQNLLEYTESEYITVMAGEVEYDKNYLLDIMLSSLYAPWEIITVDNGEELKFEQTTRLDIHKAIYKRNLFSIYSSKEALCLLFEGNDLNRLTKSGARILGINTL